MTRPVDVHIVPAADGNGVITERHFRGSEILFTVRLLSGRVVRNGRPPGET